MKKVTILLFAVTLLVGFSSMANGQSSDEHTISATANVVGAMAVGNEDNNLIFNNVLVDSRKTINAIDESVKADGGTATGVTGGEERGYFSIEIVGGTDVDYSLILPSELDETGAGNATLPITFDTEDIGGNSSIFNGFLTATDPAVTTDLTGDVLADATGSDWNGVSGTISLDGILMPESGKVYLVLGGTVDAGSSQTLGNYEADIELTATVAD